MMVLRLAGDDGKSINLSIVYPKNAWDRWFKSAVHYYPSDD
jgi:hypothetical protein